MDEQEGRLGHQSFLAMTEFILLIKSVMKQRNISAAYLARKTGLHKSKVSRGLSGSSPIDLPSIHLLFLALDIDSHRALLAVGRFGDWKRYYDPDI